MLGWMFKVVERGGRLLKEILIRSNIFAGNGCGRPDCGACRCSTKPQDCRRRGITYETTCKECYKGGIPGAVYVGESARSANERMGEHLDDAENQKTESHMRKH